MSFCIHQIWLQGRAQLPLRYVASVATWQRLHPRCTYRLWDEYEIADEIRMSLPWLLPQWQQCELIQRADIGRYVLLYQYGGIYLDMDLRPKEKSLTPLVEAVADGQFARIVLVESDGATALVSQFRNWFLYAPPRHPFFLHLLQTVRPGHRSWWHFRFYHIVASTGSVFLSREWKRIRPPTLCIRTSTITHFLEIQYDANWHPRRLDSHDVGLLFVLIVFTIMMVLVVCKILYKHMWKKIQRFL